jgi:hypothetical protein
MPPARCESDLEGLHRDAGVRNAPGGGPHARDRQDLPVPSFRFLSNKRFDAEPATRRGSHPDAFAAGSNFGSGTGRASGLGAVNQDWEVAEEPRGFL